MRKYTLVGVLYSSVHFYNFGPLFNFIPPSLPCLCFQIDEGVDVNILMFIPTMLIGVIGGLLGAAFTILNLKITRYRKSILHKVGKDWAQKLIKLFEPCIIMVSYTCTYLNSKIVTKRTTFWNLFIFIFLLY